MRRYIRKQLLDMVSTMTEANETIRRLLKKRDMGTILSLLNEEQRAAIEIGETIEKNEGVGTETVAVLEDYCEYLWECSLQEDWSEDSGRCGQLFQYTRQIRESLEREIREEYDVVFLPYKASMWDSLESVWKAAKEDSSCHCYVIPIPYYDKNSGGELHYEGDLFPDYVPITDYREYSLQKKHPEMIYFHNPYDQNNYVTSVLQPFFSSELKKYTDFLVYVPYFVNFGYAQEHFCTVPGVLNADHVILESEQVKETYVWAFIKLAVKCERAKWGKTGRISRADWKKLKEIAEQKFVAIGSPKYDKLYSSLKEGFEIPETWKPLFFKPDGEKKKVILYNTTIGAFLKEGERAVRKMQSVMGIFREEKDCVLLWRPHPLLKATLSSMRPNLCRDYDKLVEEYRDGGWGIYDDTPELYRAIALSDAYYGDVSSVTALYQMTGKPIMIQNVEVL